jgi:hypothetical protein
MDRTPLSARARLSLVRAQGIGGMRSSPGAPRWGRSDSGVPESPVFCGIAVKNAPKF